MPGPKGEKVSTALGVVGSSTPWLLGHSVGIQLHLLPQLIIPHICFFLVFPCQGEPGKFGEPGDPGEDVSRRHMGVVGGYWGQWMLAEAGICALATYCPGLLGAWCLHREPRDPLEPKGRRYVSPAPRGIPHPGECCGWHGGPGTPVPTSQVMCHMLCHLAGITRCRCTGTTRTGWASRFEGNPCPHVTLALITSLMPQWCSTLAGRGKSTLLRGCFCGPHLLLPCFRVTLACQDYQDPQA